MGSRHRERRHDDKEHEEVVNAQRVLGEIPGYEFTGVGQPEVQRDEDGEQGGEHDVEDHPARCLLRPEGMRTTIDDHQVEDDDPDDANKGRRP